MPDSAMNKMRTVHNNIFGSNPYASRHQVEKVRKEILAVDREDWETNEHDLYIHKQGNSVNQKKKTCVLSVKNLKAYIQGYEFKLTSKVFNFNLSIESESFLRAKNLN